MSLKRSSLLIAFAGCLGTSGLQGCGSEATPGEPEPLPPPRGFWNLSRDFVDTLSFGGRDRAFRVHLPTGYDHRTRRPLLLAFHGSGTTFNQMREWTDLDAAADDGSFVVVYPGAFGSWDDGAGGSVDASDVAFVRFLLEHLTVDWAVDPERVALTGFSAGGFLAHRVACEPNLGVRAVATVGATVRRTTGDVCDPPGPGRAAPVAALLVLGDQDTSVPLEGREDAMSLAESAALWRAIDRCGSASSVFVWPDGPPVVPRVRTETWTACDAGTEVRKAVVIGIGHSWPRPDTNASSVDATEIVADFVRRQW